jgi:tetratricopeptide (TPR) repeat protein
VAALRDARDLAARLPPGERDSRALDLALRLAHSLYFLGRHDESRALLLAEQARLARAGDARLRGRYHFLLARSAGLAGDNAEAERRARLAIEDAERANDASTLGQAHYLLAHEAYWTGRSRDGVGHAERAIRFLERAEERWWLGQGWWILSVNLGLLGEFGRALEAVRRCRHAGDALGDPRLQSYAAWTEGWLLAARGETDRGVELCRLAAELAPDPVSRLNARQALAYAWLEAGRNDAAIAELEPVVADLARLGVRRPEGLFTAFLGEAYRARGQLDQARAAATGALESTVALGYGYAAGLAERTLARIALDEGDPATAVKLAGGALGSFVAIGARFEEARTRLDLGEMYRALGRQVDAAREARTAADLLAALDAPRHLRLAESLAGSLGQGGVRERLPAPPERAAAPADPDRARAAQAGSG